MKTKPRQQATAKLVGLWVKLVMFSLVVVDVVVNLISTKSSFAQPADGSNLEQQIANIFSTSLPILVGVLAVVVIIVAGVVYAFDLGGGKQSGVAKEMIIAAISGVILFMLARWLLAELNSLFGSNASTVAPPGDHLYTPGEDPVGPGIIFWLSAQHYTLT